MTDYNEEVDEFAPAKPEMPVNPPVAPAVEPIAPVAPVAPVASVEENKPADVATESQNAYESIMKQQSEQIAALIAQNESLTNQITHLIKNGAQISQPVAHDPLANIMNPSLASDEDWSLEALAKDIGKRERR